MNIQSVTVWAIDIPILVLERRKEDKGPNYEALVERATPTQIDHNANLHGSCGLNFTIDTLPDLSCE